MSTATPSTPYSYTTTAGKTYFLNERMQKVGGGTRVVPFYYFSKDLKEDTAVEGIPDGYAIRESNGMPILAKIKPAVTPAA